MVLALDAELVEAAVAQAFVRLTEIAGETADRRPILEGEIAEVRRREQRLAEAISQGSPGDAAPEALLNTLRTEETRRKRLEEQLARLPQSTAVVSVDRDRVARELRTRADDMRAVLVRERTHVRYCGHCWWIDSTAGPCSSPGPAVTRSPATARSAGCWLPAPGPLPLVAPTGFEPVFTVRHALS